MSVIGGHGFPELTVDVRFTDCFGLSRRSRVPSTRAHGSSLITGFRNSSLVRTANPSLCKTTS